MKFYSPFGKGGKGEIYGEEIYSKNPLSPLYEL